MASALFLHHAWHFPVNLLTQFDHFSSVWPSFTHAAGRVNVELDPIPVQQPGGVSNDSWVDWIRDVGLDLQELFQSPSYRPDRSFHQAIHDLNFTHAGWRVLWRIFEDGFLRSCLAHRRA